MKINQYTLEEKFLKTFPDTDCIRVYKNPYDTEYDIELMDVDLISCGFALNQLRFYDRKLNYVYSYFYDEIELRKDADFLKIMSVKNFCKQYKEYAQELILQYSYL